MSFGHGLACQVQGQDRLSIQDRVADTRFRRRDLVHLWLDSRISTVVRSERGSCSIDRGGQSCSRVPRCLPRGVAHFFPVKDFISAAQLADLYTARVVSLHGIPKKISSDSGSLFAFKFWRAFQKGIGTTVLFSPAYHPQTSGQVERVNQILEDMLRACVISF